jgi:uncharacterized protein YndB with AHSA1/START domain
MQHATFVIEKNYDASPAEVFGAFSDSARRDRWFVKSSGWPIAKYTYDFRVGGREHGRFSPDGTTLIFNDTTYLDIVPNQRIVFAYTMRIGEERISSSLATVALMAEGKGTRLIYTEQGAFFDDPGQVEGRQKGCDGLLNALGAELKRDRAAA